MFLTPRLRAMKRVGKDAEMGFALNSQVIESAAVSAAPTLALGLSLILVLVLIIAQEGAAPEPV